MGHGEGAPFPEYNKQESEKETWIGIDISKDTFDAAYERDCKKSHAKFRNDTAGFSALVKWAPKDSKVVFVAIACKLLKTAYALVIKKQKYEAGYKTKILQKTS